MDTELFNFELDESRIAQHPSELRGGDRLMVLKECKYSEDAESLVGLSEEITHEKFTDLPGHFSSQDVLVLNETRVIPARFFGQTENAGKVEILLLNPAEVISKNGDCLWETLLKKKKRKPGMVFDFSGGIKLETMNFDDEGKVYLKPHFSETFSGNIQNWIDDFGVIPIPPYIRSGEADERDQENYQTVFSRIPGSVAAPTAGLHFTDEILEELARKDVQVIRLTLHVGIGTFKPIQAENINDHKMHSEFFQISKQNLESLKSAFGKKRITAVGTTVVRTLESISSFLKNKDLNFFAFQNTNESEYQSHESGSEPHSGSCSRSYSEPSSESGDEKLPLVSFQLTEEGGLIGETSIYIKPGYKFKVVDRMITNFHLPKSSLLVMVSAFAGRKRILKAYEEAIQKEYRFFSYGDSMLLESKKESGQ